MKAEDQTRGTAKAVDPRKRLALIAAAFVIAGFVGWVYEAGIGLIERGYADLSHGGIGIPFLQIYGIGAILIEMFFGGEHELRKNVPLCALAICVLTAVFEYGAGAIMLYGLGVQTWDYRVPGWDFLCTPDGLLSLRGVLSFAIMGLLLLYPIDTCTNALRKKSPLVFDIVTWVLVAVVVISIAASYATAGMGAFK